MGALDGRIAFVTGGTSGIGRAIATGLAREGATVALLVRDRTRGEQTISEIQAKVPGAHLDLVMGDLASLGSLRAAVQELTGRHPTLHLFVGAAGVFLKQRQETVDGIERTFQVNYLGHFLLANLLHDALLRGAPSRVVFVASRYGGARIPFDDLMVTRRKFTIMNAVPPTKLAEVLLTQELAERWKGDGITVNAIHPGLVKGTHLLDEVGGFWRFLTNAFGGTPEKGAETALWLATAAEGGSTSGRLWAKRRTIPTPGQGSDPAARRRLWDVSARMTARTDTAPP